MVTLVVRKKYKDIELNAMVMVGSVIKTNPERAYRLCEMGLTDVLKIEKLK